MNEARKWKDLVSLAVSTRVPAKPLEKARLTLTRYSSVEPDFDGLVSSFKHPIDGLIQAKVLENDKMSNIGVPTYAWEQVPPGKGKIRIEVREVA